MVWRELTKEKLQETKKHFADKGYVMQWYAMASEVLLTTLGPEWWKKNCTIASKSPDPFLKTDAKSEHERYIHQHRVIKLGHMLYGLKDVSGYDIFVSSLARRDLESTYFELTVASLLSQNDYDVKFVAESGEKTQDYDLRVKTDDTELCVEAKSRRDGVILTERTLRNTLEKARRQLPTTYPGVVFVSIPEQWTREPIAEDVIKNCINAFLGSTGRVNYVVLMWNVLVDFRGGKAALTLIRQFTNPRPRQLVSLERIIEPIPIPEALDFDNQVFTPSFWVET